MVKVRDDPGGDRIGAGRHDDRNSGGALLGGLQRLERPGNDHIGPGPLELSSLGRHQLWFAVGVARLDHKALLGVAKLAHPLTECVHVCVWPARITARHPADMGDFRQLLRASGKRPADRQATEKGEFATPHWCLPLRSMGSACALDRVLPLIRSPRRRGRAAIAARSGRAPSRSSN